MGFDPRMHCLLVPSDEFKIQCRNLDGEREESMDIELEVFKSGNEVNMTISWKSLIDRPILWQGMQRS